MSGLRESTMAGVGEELGSLLLRGGTVYSDAVPFATAIAIQDGLIRWIGDEEGAEAAVAGAAQVHDLAGALVTPAPADPGLTALPLAQAAALGVVAVAADPQLSRVVHSEADLQALPGGVVALLDPRELPLTADLSTAVARGVPLALASAAGQPAAPWELLRHALARGLSARAGFLAITRGAWRAATGGSGASRLQVGAPATFVVWEPAELVVQVADTERSSWSADARSGLTPLPLLAALGRDWTPPRAAWTVANGRLLHGGPPRDTRGPDTPMGAA